MVCAVAMGGGLDVTHLLRTPHPQLKASKGKSVRNPPFILFPMQKQETKGGGLRTAVAPALLLVLSAVQKEVHLTKVIVKGVLCSLNF